MKKVLSIALVLVMIFTCVCTVSADSVWDTYWNDTEELERAVIMQPGSDETQRNFSWYVYEDAECYVEIGTDALMTDAKKVSAEVVDTKQGYFRANATVCGLENGVTYYYACVTGEKKSDVYSFTTLDSNDFSALYISDIHITEDEENPENIKTTAYAFADLLVEATGREDINIILSAGDQATDGLKNEYEGLVFSPLARSISFATSIGNHDRKGIDYKYFTNLPNEKTPFISSPQGGDYYFVKGDVLFLFIDSNNTSNAVHRYFVRKAIKENPDCKWRVLVMHHDLYGGTIESRESENELLRLMHASLCDKFDIDLVLTGHSHHYSVSDVLYNNKIVEEIENGETVVNADGTVYLVSASVMRARDDEGVEYNDRIAYGMTNFNAKLYNIIDFSTDSITVTTYEMGEDEAYASFTLVKTDDYEAETFNFFRCIFDKLVDRISTLVAFFNNIGRYYDLSEDGYNVSIFDNMC